MTGTPELPPASVEALASLLGSQALYALGLIPGDDGKSPAPNLPQAKWLIDLVAVLEEKTKGNLTAAESEQFTRILHDLRMGYVAATKRQSG